MTVIRFGALQFLIAVLSIVICGGVLEAFFYLREEPGSKADEAALLRAFTGVYPSTPKDILGLKRNFKQDWFTSEFNVVVETNSAGFRVPNLEDMSEAELLIMGDSFTFGHGVNGEERYGHILGQLAKKRTLVASYNNGWAPPHYLKYFLLNSTLAPAHIVIGLCLHNDLYSDIRETVVLSSDRSTDFDIRLPFRAVSKRGTLVNAAPLANPTLEWLRNNSSFARWLFNRLAAAGYHFEFVSPVDGARIVANETNPMTLDRGEETPEARQSISYLVQLEDACRNRNPSCKLDVLLIPQNFFVDDTLAPHSRLPAGEVALLRKGAPSIRSYTRDLCKTAGLTCIDPTDALRAKQEKGIAVYFAKNGHWTAAGHRVAAATLCREVSWC